MTPIMTQDEFIQKIKALNPTFEILSLYNGTRKPVLRICTVCGDERFVQARSLLEGRACISCVAKKRGERAKKTHEQFLLELSEKNPNIDVLSEYISIDRKVDCVCKIDGHKWSTLPRSLLSGHGCPECGNKKNYIASKPRLSHEEFVFLIHTRFKNIDVLGKYKNYATKVKCSCRKCGYLWSAYPSALLRDSSTGCPRCSGKAPVSLPEFLKRLAVKNKSVRYVSGYDGMTKHSVFICVHCGNVWSALPSNILSGKSCPRCNLSKGGMMIDKYLSDKNIRYFREHRFDDCSDQRPLPFDFYLPDHKIAIEYDGEQHFSPVTFGNFSKEVAEYNLKKTQEHDRIKTRYCHKNGILLIRIPYTEFENIYCILDKHIS